MPTTPESLTKSLVTDFAKLLVNANDYNVLIKVGGDLLENSKLSRINPKNSSMAIFCADVRGPCFGGKDLCMSNMSSLNKGCSTKYTYYESDIFKSSKFDVVDYEVFQVVRKKVKINES
nr:479_t:CDS:2 [Entrophospora candida]